jgi:outer membrane protein TolC
VVDIEEQIAWAKLLPKIDLNADIDYYWKIPIQTFPGELLGEEKGSFVAVKTGTPWMGNYGLSTKMELLDVQSWQNIKLSILKRQMSVYEIFYSKRSLWRNVSLSFCIVRQQLENINITKERLCIYDNIHSLILLQYNDGLIDKISYNQSESLLKEHEENYIKSKSLLSSALMELKFWMGYPIENILIIKNDTKIFNTQNRTEIRLDNFNIKQLPDYNFWNAKIDVINQQYKLSTSSLYPKLSIKSRLGQLGFWEKSHLNTPSKWYTSAYIGIGLSIPISSSQYLSHKQEKAKKTAFLLSKL